MTLVPGDVLLTGTPCGVGVFRKPPLWLKHGDVVECSIGGIGTISNRIVDIATANAHNVSKSAAKEPSIVRLFIGTYTKKMDHVDGKGSGIYTAEFDAATGQFVGEATLAAQCANPSFLCLGKGSQQRHLYAVSEVTQTDSFGECGEVLAFQITENFAGLTPLGKCASLGLDPCYCETDKAGMRLAVPNYSSGSLTVIQLRPDGTFGGKAFSKRSGTLGPNAARQGSPHAHQARFLGGFLYLTDLGTDSVIIYAQDREGRLSQVGATQMAPGAGPRHMDFHPTMNIIYVLNELNSTITTCTRDSSSGLLTIIESISTLPAEDPASTCAQIVCHPNGRFVYASNRGHDSISCFRVLQNGTLECIARKDTLGKTPRNFIISPDGQWLIVANQDSDNIVSLKVADDGSLEETGFELQVASPVCLSAF
eukprot:g2173.t1